MFTWSKIILVALQVLNQIIESVGNDKLRSEGYNNAIQIEMDKLYAQTERGKKIMAVVNSMSDADIDDFLRSLEPK